MFAALTALDQFWNKDDELLFLGRWCIRNLSADELRQLRYTILPNPWTDRQRMYEAIAYLDRFSENALLSLSELLNQIHGTGLDTRYWRVLVSPWLVHYLHILYDRYSILSDAFSRFPDLDTLLLDETHCFSPHNTESLIRAAREEVFNLQLFSQLARAMGHNFPSQQLVTGAEPPARRYLRFDLRRPVLMLESTIANRLARKDAVAMYSMYWSRAQLWRLSLQSGFSFFPLTLRPLSYGEGGSVRDVTARESIASLGARNHFETMFWQRVADDFPEIYLETYKRTRESVLSSASRIPAGLISDSAWYFDEPFKFLAAETGRNGRLMVAQHGGGYGIARYTAAELHEERVADAYFVWGWADEKPAHHNLASPKVIKHRYRKENASILFIPTANPLYMHRFHSSPLGDQWSEYFDWQLRFLQQLSAARLRSTVYRPYPVDQGFDITLRVKELFSEVRIQHGEFLPELERARLVVVDHCGTTFLQTLAANIPTIIYWDPRRWEVRDEAIPYMELLTNAGIFRESPDTAARAVESVYDNVSAWWDGGAVQSAIRTFSDRYALRPKDWVREWAANAKAR